MRFKTLGLLMASAIGMDVYGLDVSAHAEVDTGTTSSPIILTDDYYANSSGEVYRINGASLNLLYDLDGAVLINAKDDQAIGYMTSTLFASGNYFLCNINECNDTSKRTYISGVDYLAGEHAPFSRTQQNLFSGYGLTLVTGRVLNNNQFKTSVVNSEGVILDSFITTGGQFTYSGSTTNYLTSTTGITQEEEFKLLTSSYNDRVLIFKQWNSETVQLDDIPVKLSDGTEINSAYPIGLMPIAISEPSLNNEGESLYKVALASLGTYSTADSILWGEVKVLNGEAVFINEIKEVELPSAVSTLFGGLVTSRTMFSGEKFIFNSYLIDLKEDEASALTVNINTDDDVTLHPYVFKESENGSVVLYETNVSYKIYRGSTLGLAASQINVDPYLDPSVEITLSTAQDTFFGAEVNCSLQTTNAIVDNNDYIALSPTGLQVPIEWDSTTGEWKGAQSLTGTDSLSGSHDFAQFDLTADVTTGTWTMSCSGFGSDILGNKLPIDPAAITLNLDDKIHGGSGVISGSVDLSNHGDYSGVVVTITFENGRHIEVTPDENGDFNFDRLLEGEFEVHVYNEQYVAGCNTVQVSNANTNQPLNIVMVAGDINGDDAVDIGDYSYMSSMYGLTAADEGFDAVADLNQDDVINVQDLSILGSHFGTDQCEAPLPL